MKDDPEIQPATNWFQQFKMELDARHYRVVDAYYKRDKGFYMVEVPRQESTLEPDVINKRLEYFATHWFSNAFGDKVWVSVDKPLAPRPDLRFVKVTVPSAVPESEEFDPEEVEQLAGTDFYDQERQLLRDFKAALEKRDLQVETAIWRSLQPGIAAEVQIVGNGGPIPQAVWDEIRIFLDQFVKSGKPIPDDTIRARIADLLVGMFWAKQAEEAAKEVGISVLQASANANIPHNHMVIITMVIKPATALKGVVTVDKILRADPTEDNPEVVEEADEPADHFDPEDVELMATSWEQGSKVKLMRFLNPIGAAGYPILAARCRRNKLRDAKVVRMLLRPEGLLADNLRTYAERQNRDTLWAHALAQLERNFCQELDGILRKRGFNIENGYGNYLIGVLGGTFVYSVAVDADDQAVDDNTALGDQSIWRGLTGV